MTDPNTDPNTDIEKAKLGVLVTLAYCGQFDQPNNLSHSMLHILLKGPKLHIRNLQQPQEPAAYHNIFRTTPKIVNAALAALIDSRDIEFESNRRSCWYSITDQGKAKLQQAIDGKQCELVEIKDQSSRLAPRITRDASFGRGEGRT